MRFILYLMFSLIVTDGLITQFLVQNGYGSEVNPFLRVWVERGTFIGMKVAGAFLVMALLWIKHNTMPRITYTIALFFTAFYTAVIFWNLLVFFTG